MGQGLSSLRRRNVPGFTIVELIVVVSVIAILAGIGIVSYGSWRDRTTQNAIKSDLSSAASAMEGARNFGSGYPTALPSTFQAGPNVTIVWTSGDSANYCIDGTATGTSTTYYIDSLTAAQGPQEGTCAGRTVTTPITAAPTGVSAVLDVAAQIDINWTAAANATQYRVQCASDPAFTISPLTATVSVTTATVANTLPGVVYCRVRGMNAAGNGPWSSTVSATTDVYDGLIAQWKMNGNANDTVGGYGGTVFGATLTTGQNGAASSAYSFDGATSYIDVNSQLYMNPMTISVWFKAANASSGTGMIFHSDVNGGDGYGGESEFHLNQSVGNYVIYVNAAGCISGTIVLSAIPNTNWHFLSLSINTSGQYTFYLDGVLTANANFGCTPAFSAFRDRFRMGRPTSATRYLTGALDDMRIYNRVLSGAEVTTLYNSGAR